jgi:N-alpha-acetyl-L-2,4-diaminobutyrate deacetylase
MTSAMRPSAITPTVDFDQDGIQHGFLKLPYSRDDSAWGAVMIPVAVIKNGRGPTALLTGGNHGDEYEGPIALLKLANALRPEQISGRVIMGPAMNYLAFRAARRTSPADARNMNRIFPGSPDGSVSEKIADYFQRYLLPLADYVLDFHSGGKTLDFLPMAAVHVLPDKEQQARCVAAMEAFGAPYSAMLLEMDSAGMYDTAAEEMGKPFVSTELGGGGTASARSIRITDRGLRNFLIHTGILEGEIEPGPTVRLDMPGAACFVTSENDGVVEMYKDLGEEVAAGEPIAAIHPIHKTGLAPLVYRANISGIVMARHFPGLIQPGDCLAVVAVPLE